MMRRGGGGGIGKKLKGFDAAFEMCDEINII